MAENSDRLMRAVFELLLAVGGILMFRFPASFARINWMQKEPTPSYIALVRWMGLVAAILLVISAISDIAS
jgi:hypothetical protein